MGDLKKWHIVLFVLAIVGLGVSLALSLRSNEPAGMADTLYLVDIETGELFSKSIRNRSAVVPGTHPTTKRQTLFPVYKDEAGRWMLRLRYLEGLPADQKADAITNRETGEVRVTNESATRL